MNSRCLLYHMRDAQRLADELKHGEGQHGRCGPEAWRLWSRTNTHTHAQCLRCAPKVWIISRMVPNFCIRDRCTSSPRVSRS